LGVVRFRIALMEGSQTLIAKKKSATTPHNYTSRG
jgi:hypothetical protein